ncbi:MAG: UPF0175 family protein [Armatimonadetes bacterium]|nr:UPF0175 family protein [Armatimonadota bacterium]MDW8121569.1 hypothetical protein [Armatimonadota bacterium]
MPRITFTRDQIITVIVFNLFRYEKLSELFDPEWVKREITELQEQEWQALLDWVEKGEEPDERARGVHSFLSWALLPSPNPLLNSLENTLKTLDWANVRNCDKKAKSLTQKGGSAFWDTLSEIYLARHLMRLGAKQICFDPEEDPDKKGPDLSFIVGGRLCFAEVHTTQAAEVDPIQRAVRKWQKKKEQLKGRDHDAVLIFAECINEMGFRSQLLHLDRSQMSPLVETKSPEEQLARLFQEGGHCVAIFNIDPMTGFLDSIRWYWREDMQPWAKDQKPFKNYPRGQTVLGKVDPSISPIRVCSAALDTILDLYDDEAVSLSEAVAAVSGSPLISSFLTLEQFLRLAEERGIPYFRVTETELQSEVDRLRRYG